MPPGKRFVAVDAVVKQIVKEINEAIRPAQIILFGSRARGDARPDSDIDLLLVYDGPLTKREVKVAVRRLFPEPDFGMDIFVVTSDEYERQKDVVSTVGRVAFREGVVYHG